MDIEFATIVKRVLIGETVELPPHLVKYLMGGRSLPDLTSPSKPPNFGFLLTLQKVNRLGTCIEQVSEEDWLDHFASQLHNIIDLQHYCYRHLDEFTSVQLRKYTSYVVPGIDSIVLTFHFHR